MREITLKMVATGKPGLDCGEFTRTEECSRDSHHYSKPIKKSCNNRGCPTCYPKMAWREALKAEDLLRQVHDCHMKTGHDLGALVHLVISPPKSSKFNDPDSFTALRSQAYLYADQIGMVGGCCVFHEKRGTPQEFRDVRKGKKTVDQLEIGPHFHFVGFMPRGHMIMSPDFNKMTASPAEIHTGGQGKHGGYITGWIYKTIPFRVPKFSTARHVIKYELSHASYFEGKHLITWFGCCSYNNLRVDKKTITEYCECKYCKAPIVIKQDDIYIKDKVTKKVIRTYWIPQEIINRLALRYNLPETPIRYENLLAYAL